jgi:hypothetical protein
MTGLCRGGRIQAVVGFICFPPTFLLSDPDVELGFPTGPVILYAGGLPPLANALE